MILENDKQKRKNHFTKILNTKKSKKKNIPVFLRKKKSWMI